MSHIYIYASHLSSNPGTLYNSVDGLALLSLLEKSGIEISIQTIRGVNRNMHFAHTLIWGG